MIHVDRLTTPQALDGDASIGGRERARWKDFHEGKLQKKPGINAYSHETVVVRLREMFHRKCAYCETRIPAGDVEHWRPKNAVTRGDGTRLDDGYWWLAADWRNLLYACPYCNQRRKQEMFGEEGLVTAGKGTLFPIENEVNVEKPGDEVDEKPLLLNPCVDFPEEHLRFVVEPGIDEGVLQPVLVDEEKMDPKGMTSIETFGLNNIAWVMRRQEKLIVLRNHMREIEKLVMQINRLSSGPERDRLMGELKVEMRALKSFLSEDKEDLLLARQVIPPFLKQLLG